jgi:hypothetical protein
MLGTKDLLRLELPFFVIGLSQERRVREVVQFGDDVPIEGHLARDFEGLADHAVGLAGKADHQKDTRVDRFEAMQAFSGPHEDLDGPRLPNPFQNFGIA